MSEEPKNIGCYRIINFPTTATMIGLGVFTLCFMIVVMLFTKEVPKGNEAALNIVIGAALGAFGTVVAFYFGDSKKSAQQQDTINTLAAAAPQIAADKQRQAAEKQDIAADKQLEAAETQKKD